jgi:hypothetical protein
MLDYLWTEEGAVCKKFNQSDCWLQIDNNGQAVRDIATNIRKAANVPVQTGKGWNPNDLFGRWFSSLGGFKMLLLSPLPPFLDHPFCFLLHWNVSQKENCISCSSYVEISTYNKLRLWEWYSLILEDSSIKRGNVVKMKWKKNRS